MRKLLLKLMCFFYNPIIIAEYKNNTLTVVRLNGKSYNYTGSCTVWYQGINRCSTSKEYELTGYWRYCKDGKKYIKT